MRYQFQSEHGNISFKPKIFTDAIKVLITINIGLFILKEIAVDTIDLTAIFGLSSKTVWPLIWQPITYMFIHGDIFHVLINMFVLWMFGSEMETIWGRSRFLVYYFITGIGAGLFWLIFNLFSPYSVLIGASGAIYGILLAYGMMFPNRLVYLYFFIPIKVKWFVLILGVIAFISSFNSMTNISHLTHLSGMGIGFVYIKYYRSWKDIKLLYYQWANQIKEKRQKQAKHESLQMKNKVDKILEKINEVGYDNITKEERDILKNASREWMNGKPKN